MWWQNCKLLAGVRIDLRSKVYSVLGSRMNVLGPKLYTDQSHWLLDISGELHLLYFTCVFYIATSY